MRLPGNSVIVRNTLKPIIPSTSAPRTGSSKQPGYIVLWAYLRIAANEDLREKKGHIMTRIWTHLQFICVSLEFRQRTNSHPTSAVRRQFRCSDSIWSDGYLSLERVLSVTQLGTAVALLQFILVIPATNATSDRRDCSLRCAATSQKLLEHHDARGTSELSDM